MGQNGEKILVLIKIQNQRAERNWKICNIVVKKKDLLPWHNTLIELTSIKSWMSNYLFFAEIKSLNLDFQSSHVCFSLTLEVATHLRRRFDVMGQKKNFKATHLCLIEVLDSNTVNCGTQTSGAVCLSGMYIESQWKQEEAWCLASITPPPFTASPETYL